MTGSVTSCGIINFPEDQDLGMLSQVHNISSVYLPVFISIITGERRKKKSQTHVVKDYPNNF